MDTSVAFVEFKIRSRNRATGWLTEHGRPRGPGIRHDQSPFGINRLLDRLRRVDFGVDLRERRRLVPQSHTCRYQDVFLE